MSGVDLTELASTNSAIGRMIYYRSLRSSDSEFLDIPIYAGVSIEVGNVRQNCDDIGFCDVLLSSSTFVVFDAKLGPLYLAYGVSDSGRDLGYLF